MGGLINSDTFNKLDINKILNDTSTINNERCSIDGTISFDEYVDKFYKRKYMKEVD